MVIVRHANSILAFFVIILLCGMLQAGVTLEGNLRAWWLMGEEAAVLGDPVSIKIVIKAVPDHSGKSAEAVAQGGPTPVNGVPFEPFPFEASRATRSSAKAGDSNYLLVEDDPSNDVGDGDFSVSLWARVDKDPANFIKLFQNRTDNRPFWQAETNHGGIIFNIRDIDGGNAEFETSDLFNGNIGWHHLVFVRDTANGNIRAYIDGEEDAVSEDEPNVGTLEGAVALGIGAENDGAKPFEGDLDDFRLYGVALTAEQVAAIYNDGKGDFGAEAETAVTLQDDLKGWWLLGENATTEAETIGGGDTITLSSIFEHTGNSVPAIPEGSPELVAGNPFSPSPFGENRATRSGPGPNFLLVPSHESFNFADESFSVSLWARSENGGGQYDKLFQRNLGGNTFWQAETANFDGAVIWNIRSGSGDQNAEIKTENIFDGNTDWHHLVFLRDADNEELRAYVDGVLSIDDGGTAGVESDVESLEGGGDLGIGAENNGAQPFEGDIDDFRIYDVALTEADVLTIYNNGLGDLLTSTFPIIEASKTADAVTITFMSQPGRTYVVEGAIPKFDMAERPSLLRLEYEHPNERRKDS
jgi:hypothetical protein